MAFMAALLISGSDQLFHFVPDVVLRMRLLSGKPFQLTASFLLRILILYHGTCAVSSLAKSENFRQGNAWQKRDKVLHLIYLLIIVMVAQVFMQVLQIAQVCAYYIMYAKAMDCLSSYELDPFFHTDCAAMYERVGDTTRYINTALVGIVENFCILSISIRMNH